MILIDIKCKKIGGCVEGDKLYEDLMKHLCDNNVSYKHRIIYQHNFSISRDINVINRIYVLDMNDKNIRIAHNYIINNNPTQLEVSINIMYDIKYF